jgi:hypothetical protein
MLDNGVNVFGSPKKDTFDDAQAVAKSNSVCQYRINNLKSLKCLV